MQFHFLMPKNLRFFCLTVNLLKAHKRRRFSFIKVAASKIQFYLVSVRKKLKTPLIFILKAELNSTNHAHSI